MCIQVLVLIIDPEMQFEIYFLVTSRISMSIELHAFSSLYTLDEIQSTLNYYWHEAISHNSSPLIHLLLHLLPPSHQESREANQQIVKEKKALDREHKKVERALAKEGRKPFFIRPCESSPVS